MFATLTENDFEKIFEVCDKIEEICLFSTNGVNNKNLATFKNVGLKVKLKIQTNSKKVIAKLCDAKNRLTVFPKKIQRIVGPFEVCPRILSHLYYDYSDDHSREYFYEEEDYFYGNDYDEGSDDDYSQDSDSD